MLGFVLVCFSFEDAGDDSFTFDGGLLSFGLGNGLFLGRDMKYLLN